MMKSWFQIKLVILVIISLTLISCAQPQSQLPEYSQSLTKKEQSIQNQLFADSYLNTYIPFSNLGTDILFKASELCEKEDRIYGLGLILANEHSAFDKIREEVNNSLELGPKLKIVSTGTDTPAAKAGMMAGDTILEINGNQINGGMDAYQNYSEQISNEFQKKYSIKILRDGEFKTYNVKSEERCRFNFVVDLDNNTFNAFANGEIMVFSLRMAKWLMTDEIGAAIVFAHELGHNANKHVQDKMDNAAAGALLGLLFGVYVGLPQDMMEVGMDIGASAYSIEYENEADYLSMYILALSGYDLDKAVEFWRRFAIEVPNSIYSTGGSHPSTSERFLRMEATIKEIKNKIKLNQPLLPSYKMPS